MANTVEMPKLGFDMAEGKLVRWVKAENEKVEKGEVLAEIETDKATVEVESTFSGIVAKHLVEENTVLPVGTPIAVITDEGEIFNPEELTHKKTETKQDVPVESSESKVQASVPIEEITEKPQTSGFIKASPLAKRIAHEKGIDLTVVTGTGPEGRIVKRDLAGANVAGEQPAPQPEVKAEAPAPIVSGKDEVIEISRLRTAIGKRMLESHQAIPNFTVTHSYNADALITIRKEMNEGMADEAKISVNDFFIRAAALALKQFPNLNSSISGSQITRRGDINIGVAVAVENGLLTIVVKNADQKPLSQISQEMKEMTARVKDGKLRNEDIKGSTFTISNLGMFEVEDFTAIINPPEAAILAVGSAMQVPVVENGVLAVGWHVKATLSADHRITDGAEAAHFMQHLALYLEQPWRLL